MSDYQEKLEKFIQAWRYYFNEFINTYLLDTNLINNKMKLRAMIDDLAIQLAAFMGDDW